MNLKKLKIILYLPLALFFIAYLFYYPLPAKAADVCNWMIEGNPATDPNAGICAAKGLGANSSLSSCNQSTKTSSCGNSSCLCCCKAAASAGGLNDTMPNLDINKLQVKIPSLTQFTKPAECGSDSSGNKIFCVNWISDYIAAIYKYAIGIVGILAAVVLMIGGVLWIVAGGSATMIGEAKAWIGASLTGLVIALCSYLILYQINPALTVFQPIKITQVKKAPEAAISTGVSQACQKYLDPAGTNTIKYNNIKTTDHTPYPPSCSNPIYINAFNDVGSEKARYLKAIAATETGCNPTLPSPAGVCGLMQIMPKTAKDLRPDLFAAKTDKEICDYLIASPGESIKIANKFIDNNYGSHGGTLTYIFAGYNSGYSTSPNPTTGKKGGLAPSSSTDCGPAYKAFECCINPGELTETQDYVYRALNFY